MNKFILLTCLLVGILAVQGPSAPVWPETFSQDFVQGDSRAKVYQSGKLWYDYKNNRQRVDFSGSSFDPVCYALAQDSSVPCSIVNVNEALYVNLPQKSKCCKCCTDADGCTIAPRDWLKDYQYAGEATLSGQTFYKWTLQGQNYYATEDSENIPRRIQGGTFALDFIMNTYSKNPIQDSIFQISSLCNTPCPQGTGCTQTLEGKTEVKTLRQALFGKKVLRSLRK